MNEPQKLAKTIGFWSATTIVIGSIIGSGIFMKPATMAALLGSPYIIIIVWLVAGVISICGAMAFAELGIQIEFKGNGEKEKGYVSACLDKKYLVKEGQEVVCIDPRYFRPAEVDILIGDATNARTKLGWQPKYDLQALIKEMVHADIDLFSREKLLKDAGYKVKNQFE